MAAPAESTTSKRTSMFTSLRVRNFRTWIIGSLFASTGTWMQRVGQDWLVLTVLTNNSGTATGIVTGLQFLPMLILSPIAGAAADKFDQRKLLAVTQGSQAVLAFALGVLIVTGHIELWHVYVAAFLLGVAAAFDSPGRQTYVGALVGPGRLPNAVALNSAAFNMARMLGPAAAGLVIGWVGIGWVFLINGVSFAGTLIALWMIRPDELVPMERAGSTGLRGIIDGFKYVATKPQISLILIVIGIVGMLGLNFQLTSAMMARTEFHVGATAFGMLGTILSVGSLAGSLMAARRRNPGLKHVLLAATGFGIVNIVACLMPNYALFALVSIANGYCTMTLTNSANAVVQLSSAPEMRGRVMALYMAIFMGTTPIGAPLVGWIGQTFGARWSIGVGGVASILAGVGAYAWVLWRRRRQARAEVAAAAAAESSAVSPAGRTDTPAEVAAGSGVAPTEAAGRSAAAAADSSGDEISIGAPITRELIVVHATDDAEDSTDGGADTGPIDPPSGPIDPQSGAAEPGEAPDGSMQGSPRPPRRRGGTSLSQCGIESDGNAAGA